MRARLPDGAASKIEGFVAHTTPALVLGLHLALLVVLGVIGFWQPQLAAMFSALVTVSLIGEGTGRFSLLRHLLPKSASYNLVARLPASPALGAVVVATPLDAATWRPLRRRWLWFRPLQAVFGAVLVVDVMLALRSFAEPWGPATLRAYLVALIGLGITVAVGAVYHRTGDAKGETGGLAAQLELLRRLRERPVPGVEVWFAFTGCGHAFQGGMTAFLALHERTLPAPTLVIALDHPANTPLQATVAEGALLAQHHRPTGPALVERLRWAGVFVPPVDHGGATDARAALVAGFRAVALVGGDGEPSAESVERVADVTEHLVRWYAEDLARVADVRPALEDLARATEATRPGPRGRRARKPPELSEALDVEEAAISEETVAQEGP